MNIVIFDQLWFADYFKQAGHNVITCGFNNNFDIRLQSYLLHINTVLKELPAGFSPDALLFLDNSMPPCYLGISELDIPCAFYSVDAHHHHLWHKHYAALFDYTFVAHKDYLGIMSEAGATVQWLPLWASRYMEPSLEKRYDVIFIGNMDKKLNPERVEFIDALSKKINLFSTMGKFWEYYPFSEIVLNQTVKGDLNFRVFEGMMSGALLLTEKTGNGLMDLFNDGEHLITYHKGNVDEVAERVQELLQNRRLCREIGANGRDEILRNHTEEKRAKKVLSVLERLERKRDTRFFSSAVTYIHGATSYETIDAVYVMACLVEGLKGVERGLRSGEKVSDEQSLFIVLGCLEYDRLLRSQSGSILLEGLRESYPDMLAFHFACIRNRLNKGDFDGAGRLAAEIHMEGEEAFSRSESVIKAILSMKEPSLSAEKKDPIGLYKTPTN
ncbi:MAG: glycosyltransferase family 1 protein [Candidatus Dadabacteria bacterium]|nr:MAG: glycosyltransferase family 1 protein [Candidatus Dadabacteria bacterium]